MSNPNDPGPSNRPDKDQVENLSADDLDVQELDDQLLEEAAGGGGDLGGATRGDDFSCTNYVC